MRRFVVVFAILFVLALSAMTVSAGAADRQHADVLSFADLSDAGDAYLVRNDQGITTHFSAEGVEPGVWTVWWVIWNNPEDCIVEYACLEDDLFNPDAGVAIGFANGVVVGRNGRFSVAAHLREGETLTGFAYPEFQAIGVELNETTMLDSWHAEVHLVMRHHGEAIPGLVSEALHTFNGACVYEDPIAGSEPAYGEPGPNTCDDKYFAIFPSADAP